MNRVKDKIFRAIVGAFLFALFVCYAGSVSLFTHTHLINGVTIVHSHPYPKGHTSDPAAHSESEIQLISVIGTYLSVAENPFVEVPSDILSLVARVKPAIRTSFCSAKIERRLSLRAPPFFLTKI